MPIWHKRQRKPYDREWSTSYLDEPEEDQIEGYDYSYDEMWEDTSEEYTSESESKTISEEYVPLARVEPNKRRLKLLQEEMKRHKARHKTDVLKRHRISVENANGDQECRKSTLDQFFYSTPNSKLLTLLIVITIILVVVFLVIFKYVTYCYTLNDSTNGTVGVYLSIVGVPVGVALSFIVATTWSSFSDAQAKENEEGVQILQLYKLLDFLPGGKAIQRELRRYTVTIIEKEFPLMELGEQSREGLEIILNIGDMIYALEPTDDRESGLFDKAIDIYQRIISLRVARFGYTVNGLAPELWWVLIFGVVIVIFMSFFMYSCHLTLQIILTAMSAAVLVSLLFLVIALNFPYRGDFGLDSMPFQTALANIDEDIRRERLGRKHRGKGNDFCDNHRRPSKEDEEDSYSNKKEESKYTRKKLRARKKLRCLMKDLRKGRFDAAL